MLNLVHEGERDRGSYNHCTQSEPQGTGNKTEKTTKRKQTKEKQDKKQKMGKKETKQSKEKKKKRQKTKQKRKQRSKRQKTKADSLFLVRLSFSHVLFYSQVSRAFDKFQSSYSQLVLMYLLTNDLSLSIFRLVCSRQRSRIMRIIQLLFIQSDLGLIFTSKTGKLQKRSQSIYFPISVYLFSDPNLFIFRLVCSHGRSRIIYLLSVWTDLESIPIPFHFNSQSTYSSPPRKKTILFLPFLINIL